MKVNIPDDKTILRAVVKVKCGYFVVRHGVTNGKAWSQTLVTPKGQRNIINKCLHGKWDKEYQQVMTGTFSI